MCGIAGIYSYRDTANNVDGEELLKIRDYMIRRGPDDAGLWIDDQNRIGLAHRRLAIIDPGPTGHQPMRRGECFITYNGEIYNFRKLKRELIKKGHTFKTESDTEVLLALYQEYAEKMVHHLIGMFTLAIWDSRDRRLFLARDPYGIKPFYYSDYGGQFRFASQVKALLAGGAVSKEVDPAGEIGFLMMGSIPEPGTYYSAIKSIPAGSTLIIDASGLHAPVQYCDLSEAWKAGLEAGDTADVSLSDEFRNSVNRHLVSDVPVGMFLSAGIDSGALAGLMSESASNTPLSTTIRFEEYVDTHDDESVLAAEVAKTYGLIHNVSTVSQADFNNDFPKIMVSMDQPSIDGINTWFVSKAAAEHGLKVALSGLGGDELLGSYPAFKRIPHWNRRFGWTAEHPQLALLLFGLRKFIPRSLVPPKVWGMLKYAGNPTTSYFLNRGLFMPWELPELINHDRIEAGLNSLNLFEKMDQAIESISLDTKKANKQSYHAAISILESRFYMRNQLLRDTDWAAMAHSVEVRTPLVDIQLLRSVTGKLLKEPDVKSKRCLAEAPKIPLPDSIKKRTKTGFTTPVGNWINSSNLLSDWKRIALLAEKNCHWSRRYAYSILKASAH